MKTQTTLSLQDTNVIKGFAILLMLTLHLFASNGRIGLYDDIILANRFHLVFEIGKLSRLCVAIFVFVSGYGLMVQSDLAGGVNLKDYYVHRFKKLYFNYWFIWIVFVPISVFVFGYTFQDAYKVNVVPQLITDIFGIHELVFRKTQCYNPAWWFYSCIIILYTLFPFIYKLIKKYPLYVILAAFSIALLPIPISAGIKGLFPAFVLGMVFGRTTYSFPLSRNVVSIGFLVVLFLTYALIRRSNQHPFVIDSALILCLVLIYKNIRIPEWIVKIFSFLGHHSMNIFLFHSLFYIFWFPQIIYATRNPVIIYLTLLAMVIPVSMFLELVKKHTIYKLM